jgi:hypothetical protein
MSTSDLIYYLNLKVQNLIYDSKSMFWFFFLNRKLNSISQKYNHRQPLEPLDLDKLQSSNGWQYDQQKQHMNHFITILPWHERHQLNVLAW